MSQDIITLSGFKPDEDIEIKYIGLRPGEKLFEELQYDDEKYSTTNHKKIFVRKCRENNWPYSKTQIEALLQNVYNVETAKNIIHNLVPEYNNIPIEQLIE